MELAKSNSAMIGVLKFLIFLACIFGIPIIVRMFVDIGYTMEEEMSLCLFAWIVALIIQWVIGKALEKPASQYDQQAIYHQQPAAKQEYPRDRRWGEQQARGGYGQRGRGPYQGRAPQRDVVSHRSRGKEGGLVDTRKPFSKEQTYLSEHICKECGGPIELKSGRCQYCGARR